MRQFDFEKNKYKFSAKNKQKDLDSKALSKEIMFYIKQLKLFKISLKDLVSKSPNDFERDLILNIAYSIVEDHNLTKKIIIKKVLPCKIIQKSSELKFSFIEKWQQYIIAYVLLLYTERYSNLLNYLNIVLSKVEKFSLIKENYKDKLYKGIVLSNLKNNAVILTSKGEFVRINNNGENKIGEELTGKEKIGFRHYRKVVTISILAIVIIITTAFSVYNERTSSIIIQGTSQLKIETNIFNKIVYSYSPTEKGDILLKNLQLKNKPLEDSLVYILKDMQVNNMIPTNKKVEIIITGKEIKSNQFTKAIQYMDKIMSDDNYENNFKISINNSGYEKKMNNK
ncbi:anti-sigma factor domain-containing protein [Clostridium tarantellae]|uniref:Anti-sigma factor domain-containing protein n=1 Tax=Clostridium tarantellae TaxID=39493 RepID=A0A6I1MMH0_9CLOT|nr:anti-sigma factor domain-containing protein [Clostridium tarantellae]MPQ44170.1 anti-sigma factor domain-containing protein [Clostridium tarantellae]